MLDKFKKESQKLTNDIFNRAKEKEELENRQIIEKAFYVSSKYIIEFYKKLKLNPYIYQKTINCEITPNTYNPQSIAEYQAETNTIYINEKKLTKEKQALINSKTEQNKFIEFIAHDMIHELIHSNRTVFIKEGIRIGNIKKLINNYINYQKYDFSTYNKILENTLSKSYAQQFKTIIPIVIHPNKDQTYNIIAYNIETNEYLELPNQSLKTPIITKIEDYITQVADELEEKIKDSTTDKKIILYPLEKNYQPTEPSNEEEKEDNKKFILYPLGEDNKIKKTKEQKEKKLNIAGIKIGEEFYHQSHILRQKISDLKSIYPDQEQIEQLNKITYEIINIIEDSLNFEEVLTETITELILNSHNDNAEKLSISKTAQKIKNDQDVKQDVKICTELIEILGPKFLTWYLTAAYNDYYYNNYIEEIFQNEYLDLISNFSQLYQDIISEKTDNKKNVQALEKILKKINISNQSQSNNSPKRKSHH